MSKKTVSPVVRKGGSVTVDTDGKELKRTAPTKTEPDMAPVKPQKVKEQGNGDVEKA